MKEMDMQQFYKNKVVLVTGHTGFKGTWLCKILKMMEAKVIGYSLEPPTTPSLFEMTKMSGDMVSVIGDIRDFDHLNKIFDMYQPEVVIHMAAQPLVRESYLNPRYTYETNVMGTVNICEAVRTHSCVKSFLNVTTDKVYQNREWIWGYREDDALDGYDPYSNSKSCSELVTHSYINSFFMEAGIPVSTARAGNVIGGGDFAKDRIIPDAVRAIENVAVMEIRNPNSTRPYQHVLEPLFVYLTIAYRQTMDGQYAGYYNVGPDECDCITTGELVKLFAEKWEQLGAKEKKFQYRIASNSNGPHEAGFLKLDCSKLKNTFHWKPMWHIEEAVSMICEWNNVYFKTEHDAKELQAIMEKQIRSSGMI